MYNLAFSLQVFILELRKNLRYWVMFLPIVTLILFPLILSLSSYLFSMNLPKNQGIVKTLTPDKTLVKINIDQEKYVDLKNGKRLFFSRINNRDNLKFGFRKIIYTIDFTDNNDNVIEKGDTKFENFILPNEVFYITHFSNSNKGTKMKVNFILNESNLVNILPESIEKYKVKVAELSNLTIDNSKDDLFNLSFLINNTSGKTLKNLKLQYVISNKTQDYKYVDTFTFTEIKELDKDAKFVSNLSYPLNISKEDLTFIKDNNTLRYNFFEYEQ
jgi:hypothetical protein